MKIFCNNCKHFKTFVGILGSYSEYCRAPENTKETHRGIEDRAREPKDINKNLDCAWFHHGKPKRVDLL